MKKISLSQIFAINKKTYQSLAGEYDEKFDERYPFNFEVTSSYLNDLRTLSTTKRPKILDIGCSVGIDSLCLSNNNCQVTGIDVSSKMIRLARKNVLKAKFITGNFWDYQFNEKFDGIYAQNFIHLFPLDIAESLLKKMVELLNPNGLIHLTTSEEGQSREGFFFKEKYQKKMVRYRKFWEEEELKEFFKKAGLKVLRFYKISPQEGAPWMIAEVFVSSK